MGNIMCNDLRSARDKCFADRNGVCLCLNGTFDYPCPFYKTVQQVENEKIKTKKRLAKLGVKR